MDSLMTAYSELHFLRESYLTLLWVVVPAVALLWGLGVKSRLNQRKKWGDEKLWSKFSQPLSIQREFFFGLGWVLVAALLVMAAAGPVTKGLPSSVKAGSLYVCSAIDVSNSMASEEFRPLMPKKNGIAPELVPGPYGTRLDWVKAVLENEVLPSIVNNKFCMATYMGEGFDQIPLIDDFDVVGWINRNWITIGNAPGGGSNLASGLLKAVQMLSVNDDSRERVLLLFSDGGFDVDKEGAQLKQVSAILADMAKKQGRVFNAEETDKGKILDEIALHIKEQKIRLIIVGIGSITPRAVPVYGGADGKQVVGQFKDEETGEIALTYRDDKALLDLQRRTGAEFKILDPDQGAKLGVSWASLIGGTSLTTQAAPTPEPVYEYPLLLAMLIMFALLARGVVTGRVRPVTAPATRK